ncbi:Asp-tRNA(Asn)/Glu-tRNA(Gln) amidotransferase subunit GatB [Limisalsivibrio acetivorans]|uniref:Asp-tRNA(Asn)/Glu-tRNA(Gln) amidotransferase subunit GatB n=1 Tax=Limisalsivibrio acetivorans TaxID=1304888 RepID=UPI0003B6B176|nr:Asp-tRNA(Asn)/Glu-tRNA(Gln) amidotransferase subunit GatB [Limisalsivibrio acetivorans]
MNYEAVIGLEVHVQLSTESKIFCSCSTKFGSGPNSQVCPVCMGMPGVLPVLNRNVVDYTMKAGLALGCSVEERSIFARKNYFYPDLPKGYQISQYELPICLGGELEVELESGEKKTLGITRIHIEEDAGKSIHGENLGSPGNSYVDLNRTGVPLIEIVSEPDMRSGEEARAYLTKLKTIIKYLGISDCNMEEGSLRCDANISVRPVGQEKFGTKAEIKNMNSFKNVQKAIEYEIKRQIKVVSEGGHVVQETRLWDAAQGITLSMRGKEEANDYRYFPDPDLVPVVLKAEDVDRAKSEMPELPDAKRIRFMEEYSLPKDDAVLLTGERAYADFYEAAVSSHNSPKRVANLFTGDVLRVINEKQCEISEVGISPESLAEIAKLLDDNKISGNAAKKVFEGVIESGKSPSEIVEEQGLAQVSDEGEIEKIVKDIIEANPNEAERFKNGEKKLQGFFVGQVMRASKGKANPKIVNELLNKLLS